MFSRNRIIRLPEVLEITGVCRATIYNWIEQKRFPVQVRIGKRAVGWYSLEIDSWLDGLESKQVDPYE